MQKELDQHTIRFIQGGLMVVLDTLEKPHFPQVFEAWINTFMTILIHDHQYSSIIAADVLTNLLVSLIQAFPDEQEKKLIEGEFTKLYLERYSK